MMLNIRLLNIKDPIVRIVRNIHVDKLALQQAAKVIDRRQTYNIPFGFRGRPRQAVRGRKRNTQNLVVRSVQPNIDGRTMVPGSPPHALQAAARAPSTTPTPPNPTLKKNLVPSKANATTYAQPSRPVVRRLTFPSSALFSPLSLLSPPPSPPSSPAIIDLTDDTDDTDEVTNPPLKFEQAPQDFGKI